MCSRNLEAPLPGEQQEARPKWEERVADKMTDARRAPAASLLPPTSLWLFGFPRGVTRRHMLSCPCFAFKKLLTRKGRAGRRGYHLQQTHQRWNQRPIIPITPVPTKRCFEPSFHPPFSSSSLPSLILKVEIWLMAAVVSCSIAVSDVLWFLSSLSLFFFYC